MRCGKIYIAHTRVWRFWCKQGRNELRAMMCWLRRAGKSYGLGVPGAKYVDLISKENVQRCLMSSINTRIHKHLLAICMSTLWSSNISSWKYKLIFKVSLLLLLYSTKSFPNLRKILTSPEDFMRLDFQRLHALLYSLHPNPPPLSGPTWPHIENNPPGKGASKTWKKRKERKGNRHKIAVIQVAHSFQ